MSDADGRNAVLLHELRVQLDDVARLAVETDHVDAARQRLKIRIVPGDVGHIDDRLVSHGFP